MFNGKMKAVTFSFDDGVTQDIRLIEMFNKYGLKCTFNINSELLGLEGRLGITDYKGDSISHNKVQPEELKTIYAGHEIAVHTLTHPFLPNLDDAEVVRQVEQDRLNLSKLAGYEVIGMAYPCGGENNNDHVAELIKNNTGVKYSRTITSVGSFDLQDNMYRFNPTIHSGSTESRESFAKKFLEAKTDKPMLFYIWGHSYEFDVDDSWDSFEEFCKMISGHDDVFYGTNREVFGL